MINKNAMKMLWTFQKKTCNVNWLALLCLFIYFLFVFDWVFFRSFLNTVNQVDKKQTEIFRTFHRKYSMCDFKNWVKFVCVFIFMMFDCYGNSFSTEFIKYINLFVILKCDQFNTMTSLDACLSHTRTSVFRSHLKI